MIELGIIGGGVMSEAIVSRLLTQGQYAAHAIVVSEPQKARQQFLAQTYGVQVTAENGIPASAPVLLLAIKPQVFKTIAQELNRSQTPHPKQLVLSILAGVTLSTLEAAFPQQPVVRAMPNTPATIGYAMTALAQGSLVMPPQMAQAQTLFAAIGEVVEVPESLMDAVTGLSGSGPAYVALLLEALADGGVAVGLPRATALQLALQTLRGTAELLQQTQRHPALLKDQVCSPGGTTIAGVAALEAGGFRSAVIEAVKAACKRSQELG
ncbi:MAG: pyrroline-5-carboxylate reductase [Prochlorotrichaceae cyanobacterium]